MPAMAPAAPGLPTRFPCWCRAVYSWGGETKRDLGFMEGDLIECLNAGDGSWWMGRLRRDKRMVGLFPSNFVQVLDDSFHPASRAASPLPPLSNGGGSISRAASPNPLNGGVSRGPSPSPQKSPTKSYRKPFAAYSRVASPNPTALRGPSPSPLNISRQNSYATDAERTGFHHSRAPSPAPSAMYRQHSHSRAPSTQPYHDIGSSPPPPAPPPHRVPYDARPGPSPTPFFHDHHHRTRDFNTPRPASAAPYSPNMGHTPSPLRDAMDDVMSSLKDMSMHPGSSPRRSPSPLNVWSPEAFGQHVSQNASGGHHRRARTSLGIAGQPGDEVVDDYHESDSEGEEGQYNYRAQHAQHDGPQLSNYVERMESRLRGMQQQQHQAKSHTADELFLPHSGGASSAMGPSAAANGRPTSALDRNRPGAGSTDSSNSSRRLRARKSAYELGRNMLNRTFTTRSSATNSSVGVQSTSTNGSSSTQMTSQSVMSGHSAGGFSATSAGSLARRRGGYGGGSGRPMTVLGTHRDPYGGGSTASGENRPQTPLTGVTFHSSHDSRAGAVSPAGHTNSVAESAGILGGLTAPRPRKSGFFKKMIESAKTGAASARSSIAAGQAIPPQSPVKSMLPNGVTAIAGGNAARDMGLGGGGSGSGAGTGGSSIDWVQVRRDVNRSNSLSRNEKVERRERCQMMDYPAIAAVDLLYEYTEGDERSDGRPVQEPTNFQALNLGLVDKTARFINSLPPMTNPVSLAQGYVCRPYRSDVQRLRSIFTWVSEKIAWEADYDGDIDARRVIQLKRGCAEEVSVLVMEMCLAVGIHAEVVRGYLKAPGEAFEADTLPPANHWWNAVVVDGVWRIMDCSLASPTNPKRSQYSSANSQAAESWWCLARPMEICYTHVPMAPEQQHLCPPVHHDVLMALPCASPPYFKTGLHMVEYDTSALRIEGLELVHISFAAPADIECVAEVETRAYERDQDGDFFESGELIKKRALAQAEWVDGHKRYTVKALLPGDEGQGTLKVYAGKRGLMHSIKDNPHPLALALPIIHTGMNPPYEFLTRHPTPHAQRHDLYVAQPQCSRLAVNNTFVFAVRQHPSSVVGSSSENGSTSPIPGLPARPSSAMSMTSSSAAGSNPSTTFQQQKPAKLAIQAPSGKILRLMRKSEHMISTSGPGGGEAGDGGVWETIIKCGERGLWRGLVLADRSARWCVFAEWTCV